MWNHKAAFPSLSKSRQTHPISRDSRTVLGQSGFVYEIKNATALTFVRPGDVNDFLKHWKQFFSKMQKQFSHTLNSIITDPGVKTENVALSFHSNSGLSTM